MGGGGSKSKADVSVSNKIISEVLTKTFIEYSTRIQQAQVISVSGSYNVVQDIVQHQAFNIDSQAVSGSHVVNSMQAEMANKLQQAAATNTQAVLSAVNGKSEAEVNSRITNEIRNVISDETVIKISVGINQQQGIYVSGNHNIVKNISQDQLGDMVTEAVKNATQRSTFLASIDNALEQKAASTQENPLSVIGDILDSAGNAMGKVLGIGTLGAWAPVLLFIIVIAIIWTSGRSKSISSSPYLKPRPANAIKVTPTGIVAARIEEA